VPRLAFALVVRAEPGVDAIRSLRAWLKRGLRSYSLRCVDIRQVHDTESEVSVHKTESAAEGVLPGKTVRQ